MLEKHFHSALRIEQGRIVDFATGRDEIGTIHVVEGVVAEESPTDAFVIDARGCLVCPGLADIHVHLREPGQQHKETIETGTAAAAAGGFTLVACMPNTMPPIDSPRVVQWVLERAAVVGSCRVGVVGCITRGREGKALTDFAALKDAGVLALSDDGSGVDDDMVMAHAFEEAARQRMILIQHCEYRSISAGGVMHLGEVSRRLGLPGLDARSEEAMIERDLKLCRQTGARYHVAHISTGKSVALVRRAKGEGLPVTAEVCPHHLILTEEACSKMDPNTKMHPPLRTAEDVEACREGLVDGTIDCIVTDHAPHTVEEKAVGFLKAPAGIVGLETALGVAARAMVESGLADWKRLLRWFASGRDVLGLSQGGLEAGERADISVVDPAETWVVAPEEFCTKGRNTPFGGWRLCGRAVATVLGRRVCVSRSRQ